MDQESYHPQATYVQRLRVDLDRTRTELETVKEAVRTYLTAEGHELCHADRWALARAVGLDYKEPGLVREIYFAAGCVAFRTELFGHAQPADDLERRAVKELDMAGVKTFMKFDPPSIEECEKAIGIAAELWKGRCAEIAGRLNDALKLGCTHQYGFYTGPWVATDAYPHRRPFFRHGWLLTPHGMVVDFTRWVFTGSEPHVFYGPPGQDYDVGMAFFHLERLARPMPPPDGDKLVTLDVEDPVAQAFLRVVYGDTTLPVTWAFHLGNLPPVLLGESARPIYEALIKAGRGVLIPQDYREMVGLP